MSGWYYVAIIWLVLVGATLVWGYYITSKPRKIPKVRPESLTQPDMKTLEAQRSSRRK